MHEYHSQHRVLTIYSYTSFAVFLAKHVGKHSFSSGTFYVAFRRGTNSYNPGQLEPMQRPSKNNECNSKHKQIGQLSLDVSQLVGCDTWE